MNANEGGHFLTSRETGQILNDARLAISDLLGAGDPNCVVFGANMTTLTFQLSRALAQTWNSGDEVIVTSLDHDANVTPWIRAAADVGAVIHTVNVRPDDCTLDLDDLKSKLSERTRLVAIGYASNIVGTINPIHSVVEAAHAVGAQVFVDAVHFAPHGLIDVVDLDCDYLACSAYKFFGPHVGILWGRRRLLEELPAYKVRPASDALPEKWMTGTQNHEGIAGVTAAVDYLADLGHSVSTQPIDRREALERAYSAIVHYERGLFGQLIAGLRSDPDIRVWGIVDPVRFDERVPTLSFTHRRHTPDQIARFLADRGIFVWSGNFYALPFTEALGLEPDGTVRVGLMHYNTADEVDRLLSALSDLS
jgi:cysteine desulfurase family protein (TIGR01976 family)